MTKKKAKNKIALDIIDHINGSHNTYMAEMCRSTVLLESKRLDKNYCARDYQLMMKGGYFNDIFIFMYPFMPIEIKMAAAHA